MLRFVTMKWLKGKAISEDVCIDIKEKNSPLQSQSGLANRELFMLLYQIEKKKKKVKSGKEISPFWYPSTGNRTIKVKLCMRSWEPSFKQRV